jgi:hypothetical protein
MRTLVVAVSAVSLALAVAACGGGAQSAGPVPTVASASSETLTFELWFTCCHRKPYTGPELGCCAVGSTSRTADQLGIPHRGTEFAIGPHVFETLIEALLEGPTEEEEAYGFGSEIGAEGFQAQGRSGPVELLGVSLDDSIVTVDFSPEGSRWGGRSELFQLAQVVYTVTQFPEIQGVRFELDGRPLPVPGGDDRRLADFPSSEPEELLDRPVTRQDYERAIFGAVTIPRLPLRGAEVKSPAHIVGTRSFGTPRWPGSAEVTAVVLDAAGAVLAKRVATIGCGSGCPVDYEIDIPFDVSERQSGVIELHREDALCSIECPPYVIPVTLVP